MAVKLPGWHRCAHAHGDGHTIELQCQVVCPLYFKSFPVQNIEGCNILRWSYKIQDELQQWALISESGMKFYFSRDYRNVATHFSNNAWCDQSSTNYGVIDLQHVLQSLVNCFLTAKAIYKLQETLFRVTSVSQFEMCCHNKIARLSERKVV